MANNIWASDREKRHAQFEAQEVKSYAKQYSCTLLEAFYDCIGEGPFTRDHALLTVEYLGIEIDDKLIKYIDEYSEDADMVSNHYAQEYGDDYFDRS
jgi:hypothetical protein